ncbi:TonB-dependent receptor plug domain-containing protein [Pseudoxanthomonas sp. UC19_8]|uniref:TonB-dependent receptor plug domain-containing protein n=1 Tax=Pseudoxanthomonas sp. UC19_8 TaxID=3350175 RepID=UPI0036D300F0
MNAVPLQRRRLCHGIALALLVPATAWSQETTPAPGPQVQQEAAPADAQDATDLQTVQVKGVRAALTRSNDLKRDASTVQDSITALELGKFPDNNVADSLSHITGVSISRTAGGEGQKVSVRGLGRSTP